MAGFDRAIKALTVAIADATHALDQLVAGDVPLLELFIGERQRLRIRGADYSCARGPMLFASMATR